MEHMSTVAPCNTQAWVVSISCGIGLILNTGLIQIVPAYSTGICTDSPRPHSYCVPFLDLKSFPKLALHGEAGMHLCHNLACQDVQSGRKKQDNLFLVVFFLYLHLHGFCFVSHSVSKQVNGKSLQAIADRSNSREGYATALPWGWQRISQSVLRCMQINTCRIQITCRTLRSKCPLTCHT